MARTIEWSKIIAAQIDVVLIYLYKEWNETVADEFQQELLKLVELLSETPTIGVRIQGDIFFIRIRMYRLYYSFNKSILKAGYLQDMRSNKEMIEVIENA